MHSETSRGSIKFVERLRCKYNTQCQGQLQSSFGNEEVSNPNVQLTNLLSTIFAVVKRNIWSNNFGTGTWVRVKIPVGNNMHLPPVGLSLLALVNATLFF